MKKKLALIFNILILVLEITGVIVGFIVDNGISLKYYTNLSNVFSLASSLIFIIVYLFNVKRFKKVSKYLRLISATVLLEVFLIVICMLAPKDNNFKFFLFHGSFLYFHFLVPIISTISFIFFEEYDFKYLKDSLIALTYTIAYALSMVVIVLFNGGFDKANLEKLGSSDGVIPDYVSWMFSNIQFGILAVVLSYLFGLFLIFINKMVNKKRYKYQDTIYYSDLLNDDFGTPYKTKQLPKNYKYIGDGIWKVIDFVLYRIIARPIAYMYMKFKFNQKIIGKKNLKKIKGGYFIYANHTLFVGDAFTPNLLEVKRKNYIITGEASSSLTGILNIERAVGAIPLSKNLTGIRQFLKTIDKLSIKSSITIYPEAHIWPYYTKVRPFKDNSFKYPVKLNKPIIVLTNTYSKKKLRRRPVIKTFIDGPFYPDPSKSYEENLKDLSSKAYNVMKERTEEYSTYNYYNYEYSGDLDD